MACAHGSSASRRLLSSHDRIQVDISIMADSPVAANAMVEELRCGLACTATCRSRGMADALCMMSVGML